MKHEQTTTSNFDRLLVLLLIVVGLAAHFMLSLRYGIAVPTIHDEFGYLLTGDTFAAGRLTNPTPAMWEHFQTFHEFFHPTYQAKFPPFQGLFLAIGQVIGGQPIWGVWLSLALAYAAVFWLFRARFSVLPALAGTLMVVVQPNIMQHWGHTYWGGGVAFLGGALFFGGIAHSRNNISAATTILMALGIIILANSRPFESAWTVAASLPLMVWLALKGRRSEGGGRHTLTAYLLPLAIGGLAAIAWLLIYNDALGGDPFRFYYLNWEAKSVSVDLVKHYRGSPQMPATAKLARLWDFFLGPYLSLSLVGVVLLLKRGRLVFELLVVAVLVGVSVIHSQAWPHYIAPVAPLIYLLVFEGFHEISRIGIFKDRNWSTAVLAVMVSLYVVLAGAGAFAMFEKGPAHPLNGKLLTRKAIADKLLAEAGRDLVVVDYSDTHNSHAEWVYNRADIDDSQIVWARNLGAEKNRRLFDYYADRHIWIVYADEKPVRLMRLEGPVENPQRQTSD